MTGKGLEVGRSYFIKANRAAAVGVYCGLAEVGEGDRARELPRFWPVRWVRGGDGIDPDWPIYAGPRARLRALAGDVVRPASDILKDSANGVWHYSV